MLCLSESFLSSDKRDCAVQCSLISAPPLKFSEQPAQPLQAITVLDTSVESDGSASDQNDVDYISDDTTARYKKAQ